MLIDEGKADPTQDGNDFTIEFNYGAIETDEDGYDAGSNGLTGTALWGRLGEL